MTDKLGWGIASILGGIIIILYDFFLSLKYQIFKKWITTTIGAICIIIGISTLIFAPSFFSDDLAGKFWLELALLVMLIFCQVWYKFFPLNFSDPVLGKKNDRDRVIWIFIIGIVLSGIILFR
jgi:hypothetical protein